VNHVQGRRIEREDRSGQPAAGAVLALAAFGLNAWLEYRVQRLHGQLALDFAQGFGAIGGGSHT